MKVEEETHGGGRTSTVMDGIGGVWTDEMHRSYLKQMEACFVRRMWCSRWLDQKQPRRMVDFGTSSEVAPPPPPPPLNRYVPDGESSSGSRKRRRSRNRSHDHEDDHRELSTASTRRNKLIKRALQPTTLDEQVVPVFGTMETDDNHGAGEQLDCDWKSKHIEEKHR